jgi:hypothetical protein
MSAEIVKPDKSSLPAGPTTLPAGWRRATDSVVDETTYRRRAVYTGVKTSNDAAQAAIKAFYGANLLTMSADAPETSGVGRITAEYATQLGTGGSDDNTPVAEDTYQLEPCVIPTALAAHPAFAAVAGAVMAIDDALSHGQVDLAASAASTGGAAAQKYLALVLAGVTQWEACGYIWRVTRHYSTRCNVGQVTGDAILAANKVVAWSAVEGNVKIAEPKYTYTMADGTQSAATSFEWRIGGPQISRTADALDISYTYTGAWKWAAALYPGGSWNPTAPT